MSRHAPCVICTVLTATAFIALVAATPAVAAAGGKVVPDPGAMEVSHFDPKGKPPSKYTIELQNGVRASLPFEDRREFDEVKKGFVAAPPYEQIMADAGHVAWDMASYGFLLQDRQFDSIHPSLQRQAVLNMAYGLYEVVPGRIYQVRGFDLANVSIIRGDTGWIIIDPLTAKETARAALAFVNEKLGRRPVAGVIYTHSHGDHFGGVRGVVDESEVRSGKVPIIAPVGFMQHAIAENVYAGNAMTRRLFFQYGVLLPRSPYGHVDQSIGKNVAAGNTGLIAPTRIIEKDFDELTIDGVRMEFQNTPGTEAPAEMNIWFPQFKAFCAAENITGTIHNIYTLRGALVRDALAWSKYINAALYRYGDEATVMFASHSWPRWGNERIQDVMRTQRDVYANLNNSVLRLANQGVTINEVHNVYQLPPSLQRKWAARSYHGSEAHNSRAVINRYLGYWDANPATLIPLSPRDSAPLYVEMMGGAERIITRGRELHEQGRYLEAVEILNKLVYAQPDNQVAKDQLADAFEQIGYQKESPSLRNSFLAAAFELRHGLPSGHAVSSISPDTIRGMSTDLWLDFLAIRLDSSKADDLRFTCNLVTPDNGEMFVVEVSHGTMTSIEGTQSKRPDLTITVNRTDLEQVMAGKATFDDLIAQGKAKFAGDRTQFDRLRTMLVRFTPDFEMVPGTRPGQPTASPATGESPAQPVPADASGI